MFTNPSHCCGSEFDLIWPVDNLYYIALLQYVNVKFNFSFNVSIAPRQGQPQCAHR